MKTYHYEVISNQQSTPTSIILTLRRSGGGKQIDFKPGQYVTLTFIIDGRPTEARCFSISSSPTEKNLIRFTMRVSGKYTTAVSRHAVPGTKVTVRGPFGHFYFDPERDTTAVWLAGGIGSAPFLSMAEYITANKLPNDVIMLYACATQEEALLAHELMALDQQNPHFFIIFSVASGPLDKLAGARVANGFISEEVITGLIKGNYGNMSFFVCGPPPFMKSMVDILHKNGTEDDSIFAEEFDRSGNKHKKAWFWSMPTAIYASSMAGILLLIGSVLATDTLASQKASVATTTPETQTANDQAVEDSSRDNDLELALNTDYSNGDTAVTTTDTTPTDSTSSNSTSTTTNTTTNQTNNNTQTQTNNNSQTPSKSTTITAPTLTLSISSTSVTAGKSVTVSWSAGGTSPSCTASGGWSGSKATSGSQTLAPSASTTYTLKCSNSAGSTTKSVSVSVVSSGGGGSTAVAPVLTFGTSATSIVSGKSATLSWSAGGTSPSCTASGGWSGGKATSGSQAVSPTSTTTYILSCANAAGTVTKQVTISVTAAPPPPPVVTAPTLGLTVSSQSITAGQSVNITWSASGTSVTCIASGGWSGSKPLQGTQTVSPGSTTTYSITCSNSAGKITKSATITVTPATKGS